MSISRLEKEPHHHQEVEPGVSVSVPHSCLEQLTLKGPQALPYWSHALMLERSHGACHSHQHHSAVMADTALVM